MCGATAQRNRIERRRKGLSPRVRGNRQRFKIIVEFTRSIPACAGQPISALRRLSAKAVYPRVCGATSFSFSTSTGFSGLSPRVRGNPRHDYAGVAPFRSIPACAGQPLGIGVGRGKYRVYPRVCGATESRYRPAWLSGGLSPRVRGNLLLDFDGLFLFRSIPACAGQPSRRRSASDWSEVYPRVCGATPERDKAANCIAGLSPRVRGNHSSFHYLFSKMGSIPACAGQPMRPNPPQWAV